MNALIYARLSKADRGSDETTIDDQVRYCLERATERGETCDIDKDVYREGEGRHSGRSLKHRPAMRQLLERLKWDTTIGSVIVYEQERSARDVQFSAELAALCNRVHVDLVSVRDPGLNIKTASGRMVYNIKSAVSQHYADYISERVQDHHARAHRNGWIDAVGAPCGLELVGSKATRAYRASLRGVWTINGYVVLGRRDQCPFPASVKAEFRLFLDTVKEACELIASGLSFRAAALKLFDSGYYWTTRSDTPILIQPYHLTPRRLLPVLPHYAPYIGKDLVHRTTRRIHERMNRRQNGGRRQLTDDEIPALYRLVYCDSCGRRLTYQRVHSHHTHWLAYYSHHYGKWCAHQKYHLSDTLESKVLTEIKTAFTFTASQLSRIRQLLEEQPKPAPKKDRRAEIQRQLENAKRLLIKELLSEADYRNFQRECTQELARLDSEPESPKETPPDNALEIASSFPELVMRATRQELNLILRDLIRGVYVRQDGSYRVEWKPWVVPLLE